MPKYYMTKKWELGNTLYFECQFKAYDGSLTDPLSPVSWKIENSKGEVVGQGSGLKKREGIYYTAWQPQHTGDYLIEWKAQMPGGISVVRRKFKVIKSSLK